MFAGLTLEQWFALVRLIAELAAAVAPLIV